MTKVKVRPQTLAQAKAKGGLQRVGPVKGLYVQIGAATASWVHRYRFRGQSRDSGLGALADVPLKEAEKLARAEKALIRSGVDPVAQRQAQRAATAKARADRKAPQALSFKAAAIRYLADHDRRWTRNVALDWARSFKESYAVLGKLKPADIEVRHILAVLKPGWEAQPVKWGKVRGRIEAVLDACRARREIEGQWENPASWRLLQHMLPATGDLHEQKHRTALPVAKAPAFAAALAAQTSMAAKCLLWITLTAVRASEAMGARWSEIDTEAKVWAVPADRVGRKGGGEHVIPLSQAALDLLADLPRLGGEALIFPAPRGGQLLGNSLRRVIADMGGASAGWADTSGATASVHGLRSCFRDFAGDESDAERETAEAALGHRVGNSVEQAYRRGSALAKRAALMTQWACFLGLEPPPPVDDLAEARRARLGGG